MTETPFSPDHIASLLQERARLLAQPPAAEPAGNLLALLVTRVGAELLGVDISVVREVQPLTAVTPVPGLPAYWTGLANVRGLLLPVLNLGRYLGQPEASDVSAARLVLVETAGLNVALAVDDVLEVRGVPQDSLGASLRGDSAGYPPNLITGVTADLLAVLNLEALLSDPRLAVQDATA